MTDPAHPTLPGKNPELPPTPSLSPAEFELFTERLLSAHRYSSDDILHVVDVERWGRPGDKQDGIDFKGTMSDGTTAAWQCKRLDALPPADVKAAVEVATYDADRYYLVYSGEASSNARTEIGNHPKWEILDQRHISRLLEDIPLGKRRDVLDNTFGRPFRKLLLGVPGEDAYWSIDTFHTDRTDPDTVLNDFTPFVGRTTETTALKTALDRTDDSYPIVITVTGPGGRGKTRLVTEVLIELQETNKSIPVMCLAPGRTVDQTALDELPHTPAVIFIDDGHLDPTAISKLLTYARTTEGTQLVIATRPSAIDAISAQVNLARFLPSDQTTIPVEELTRPQARTLITQLTDGLNLALPAREYLANQATHSPDLAVITTNLIRRGELTAALPLDTGLRAQVISRYQDLRAANIEGFEPHTVRLVLATYTALQPDLTDPDLVAELASFCGLNRAYLLRLNEELRDRGAIVTTNNRTRVVPDLLADAFLEGEAAAGATDLGFASELWERFNTTHRERLVTSLAELDWRLRHKGGPAVMDTVWDAIDTRLQEDRPSWLCAELDLLSDLAITQPTALVERLETLRTRLATNPPTPSLRPSTATGSTSTT